MSNPFDDPGSQIADEDAAQERRDAERWRHEPGPRIEYIPLSPAQLKAHEKAKRERS
jgi:hypothetical protein